MQLVRAVEESRTNNNTLEQSLARMRMALLMGALHDLKQIVDHSWQTIPYGQLSIAHFVQVNMPDIITDCREHWNGENRFIYPVKGVSEMRLGEFIISEGTLQTPSMITRGVNYTFGAWFPFRILIGKPNPTFGDLKNALGLNALDYITLLMEDGIYIGSRGVIYQSLHFIRLFLADGIPDDTPITSANVAQMFTYEGNTIYRLSISVATGVILVEVGNHPDGIERETLLCSVIVSRWTGKVWARNNARFLPPDGSGGINFEDNAPRWVFQSWFSDFDPESDDAGQYPGK